MKKDRRPDIYWLAGLLEGEGCFSMSKTAGGTVSPRVVLHMTDPDIVALAASIMEAKFNGPYKGVKKDRYTLFVQGQAAAEWMQQLRNLMGRRRRARIDEILTAWSTSPRSRERYARSHSQRRREMCAELSRERAKCHLYRQSVEDEE